MTNPILERLSAAMDTLLSEFAAAITDLHIQANQQRKDLIAVLAAMQGTQTTLDGVATICDEGSDVFDGLAEDCELLLAKMGDAMEDPADACPHCNFEDLLGFCEHCGAEITEANLGALVDDEILCSDCSPVEEDEDTEEPIGESPNA